ncbi:MAG: ImmA/IrrE family metallo-endopeptidase [Caldilineaceae bacterium SB0662_bin_9]|uniref:ImmA/IrrE family metallo-endopeptidase n=1 Tax=Caldilineaceae bacterium SB0662_bin_9 TaxID=2605258 RepID=A0A6B1DNY9_9CHLR|nr:XRE family transcriptional regulator [Caldilineaceae bacterium]MYD89439.1 ImmA/IrrE family metallo-endopeptidase [Caldilineaceae bacterium SB0662_bin_9]
MNRPLTGRQFLRTSPKTIGAMLRHARKARGLTQSEAAESLGVARTTLSAIETGNRQVRPDELLHLSEMYGRTLNELIGAREIISDFPSQFRMSHLAGTADDAETELFEAVHRFQRLCEDYLFLETTNGVSLRRDYPPEYPIMRYRAEQSGQDAATAERNRLGLGDGPIPNLRQVLEDEVGLRVFTIPLPSEVTGIFVYNEALGGCMAVNELHPTEHLQWSLSLEYGHFLTARHRADIAPVQPSPHPNLFERCADAFAGAFLMPATGLQRRFNQAAREAGGLVTPMEIMRLAVAYQVTFQAMTIRLEKLRHLPKGTWERLVGKGFKVSEAQKPTGLQSNEKTGLGLPMRYQLLACRAFEEGEITESHFARLLRLDRLDARAVRLRFLEGMVANDELDGGLFSQELRPNVETIAQPG